MMMKMVTQHISTMTKSHHGGEMSVMIKVGMCQCQIPTIHDKLQLSTVIIGKLFNSSPVLKHKLKIETNFIAFSKTLANQHVFFPHGKSFY